VCRQRLMITNRENKIETRRRARMERRIFQRQFRYGLRVTRATQAAYWRSLRANQLLIGQRQGGLKRTICAQREKYILGAA